MYDILGVCPHARTHATHIDGSVPTTKTYYDFQHVMVWEAFFDTVCAIPLYSPVIV